MTAVLLSVLMGGVLGFSAHRAGLCTVKAAAEILTTRRGHFLLSFAKSAAWVMALVAVGAAFGQRVEFTHWPLTGLSVFGGILFGIGAAFNGGCTFSTLTRAVDGHVGLWITLAAWPAGMWLARQMPLELARPMSASLPELPPAVLILLWMALLRETVLILRRAWHARPLRRVVGCPVYTLSVGAALVGVSNAIIVETTGPWSFSSTILCGIGARAATGCGQSTLPWAILGAAVLGMLVSSLQRGSFALRLPAFGAAMRHVLGGVLMGFGMVLMPGGNEGLILFAIPSGSPHAVPAYLGLFGGILATLAMMRALGRPIPPVICRGDVCRMEEAETPR